MRVGIQTWGSEGDLRPFVALAGGLARAGHEVELAYTCVAAGDVRRHLAAAPFRAFEVGRLVHSPDDLRRLAARIVASRDVLRQLRLVLREFFDPLAGEMLEAARGLGERNDVLVRHFLLWPTALAVERRPRPLVDVFTVPCTPTRHLPPAGLPDLGPWLNLAAWRLGLAMLDRSLRGVVNEWRAREGLAPVRRVRDLDRFSTRGLVAVSPALFPTPDDWPPRLSVCGFLDLAEAHTTWQPPAALAEFLDRGPTPVYATFGSLGLLDPDPSVMLSLVTEAVSLAGCRAIVQVPPDAAGQVPPHPDVHLVGPLPHSAVLPRCSAVVHHGGAGTTQSALLAGRPSVVVAHATDQPFWGRLLAARGLAPPPLHRRGLGPAALARALRQATASAGMLRRAVEVGARMSAEDGVSAAVRVVEEAGEAARGA